MNEPIKTDSGAYVRLNNFVSIEKERKGEHIKRENQEYQLIVNYSFIGDFYLGSIVSDRIFKEVKESLPVGYTVSEGDLSFWKGKEKKLTWAVFYTIGIVFIICAVFLNSLLQALAVIAVIPISFIGIFITSGLVDYRFDEGGYAAFIILSGVVVNAALYFLNDYNNLINENQRLPGWRIYLKAYNSKIIPVLLSTVSMIIGLIPFIIYSKNEPFWYAMAISIIGGLISSLIAILLFLPLLLKQIKNGLALRSETSRNSLKTFFNLRVRQRS
jgi:multidrug efflux pump subunit AcrB